VLLPLWANSLWSFAPNCIFCLIRRRCALRACRFSNTDDIWNRNGQRCSRFPFRRSRPVANATDRQNKTRAHARYTILTGQRWRRRRRRRRRRTARRSVSVDWHRRATVTKGTHTKKDVRTTSSSTAESEVGGGGTDNYHKKWWLVQNDIILSLKKKQKLFYITFLLW